jgi:hypothetical protein
VTATPPDRPGTAICSWCGTGVERDDGYRLAEPAGERRAAFCRLEHVVPWAIQGPHWEAGVIEEPAGIDDALDRCARCSGPLPDRYLLLVRHRGDHRIPDAFCSTDHLREWAQAGGRFGG